MYPPPCHARHALHKLSPPLVLESFSFSVSCETEVQQTEVQQHIPWRMVPPIHIACNHQKRNPLRRTFHPHPTQAFLRTASCTFSCSCCQQRCWKFPMNLEWEGHVLQVVEPA